MISALFQQPNYAAAKKMLDVTALRHEAIAANIANLETPNYKRLDISPSFNADFQRALQSRDPAAISNLQPALAIDASATAANRDGNTVQLESELLNLSQNSLQHTFQTQLVSGSLLRLRLAITGRPG